MDLIKVVTMFVLFELASVADTLATSAYRLALRLATCAGKIGEEVAASQNKSE